MNPKSDGSTADYYKLPHGATELQDLISHRDMNAQVGEIFRACYRYGLASHSDKLRDAKKVLFYAQAEIKRLEGIFDKGINEKRAVGDSDGSDTTSPAESIREFSQAVANMTANASEAAKSLGDFLKSSRGEAKPSWEDAPDWAQWLAQDENGNWFWYATQPKKWNNDQWVEEVDPQTKYARLAKTSNPNPNWRNTLEPRPTTPDYADGEWHEWHGGECPVPTHAYIEVQKGSGLKIQTSAGNFVWTHDGDSGDIIRFRVVK